MDFAIDIGHGVIDHSMLKLIQAFVGYQRIGEDRGAGEYVFAQFSLKSLLLGVWNYCRPNPAALRLAAAFERMPGTPLKVATPA